MKFGTRPQLLLLTFATLLFNAGCALMPPSKDRPPQPPRPPVSDVPAAARKPYWHADGVQGAPWIVIVLAEQRAYFFKDKTIVGETNVSSGKKRFETPPGEYKVIQKNKDHVSNLYGKILAADGTVLNADADMSKDKLPEGATFSGAKMPYFLRFQGGYGMHAGRVPNYRASHGCVRMPAWIAPHFFANAAIGTPVSVIDQIPAEPGKRKKAAKRKGGFRLPFITSS